MTGYELALKFAPHFYADEKEPFPIRKVGYAVLNKPGDSPSFMRKIRFRPGVGQVIEYGVFWDFDIQHMYDLEHVWIYLDEDGNFFDAESSIHGTFINCWHLHKKLEDSTHLPVYLQPGKHAILPDPQLSKLFGNFMACCDENAGGGMLENELFRGRLPRDAELNARIKEHICANYRFTPTMNYVSSPVADEDYIPLQELFDYIPARISFLLDELGLR